MLSGKKAEAIADPMDFLFTFILAFFLFFFISGAFSYTIDASRTKTLNNIADFNRLDAAVRNLQITVQEGSSLTIEEIDQRVRQSKILGGKTITTCADYYTPEDCAKDTIGLYQQSGDYCSWNEEKHYCVFNAAVVAES